MAQLGATPPRAWHRVRVQTAALVLGTAILLASGMLASFMASSSLEQLVQAASRAREQSDVTDSLLLALEEAETGQRGYLLTQRPSYLDPYQGASARVGALLARLERLAEGTPWLRIETARLDDAVRLKLAELQRTIELAQTQGFEPAIGLVQTDAGRPELGAARTIAARISERAEAERASQAEAMQVRQRSMAWGTLAGLAVGLLALALTGLRLLRNQAALAQARDGERRESERLHAAIEHVRDGVAVFDKRGRLILRNARFGAAIGLPAEQVAPGKTLAAVAAAAMLQPPVLDGARPGPRPAIAEVRQGERVLEVWRSAMPDGGQMVAVADISRRVQAEAIARQAQKMEMIGQMTGGLAHDFNNLLQVVSANLELAIGRLQRGGAEQSILDRLDAAGAATRRGAELTRHLLAFARRQPLAPEAVDPTRLLLGMEDMLRRTLGEAVDLRLVIGSGLWAMRADRGQMESALLNLALNARDAMLGEDGVPAGRVTLEVANATLDADYARRHDEVEPGHYLMFALSDSGVGMTAEQLGRAMEPFYTTKPDGKGTGLGLPMVFGFAKQSGGHFQLYSEPGRGTAARLYIPRTTETVERPASAPTIRHEARGELVLLVEDNPSVRRVAAGALRTLNYSVQEASSGDEALALLRAGMRPTVLFTDVVMPGAVGSRELAIQAQAMLPGIAVLFTSGYTQEAAVHNGQIEPGLNLISKPWRTEELGRALQAALETARRAPVARRRRVLLVEDEAIVRMTTADALADLGFDVLEADSGGAALVRLQPAPDLVVTDLGLPDMDGMELVARLREALPGLPVVVASGRSETPAAGVVYLSKPYDGRGLKAAVDRALQEKALAG